MATYYGFFDATLDNNDEYDRAYNAGHFQEFFGNFIGSGVCVYNNANSMKVIYEDSHAVVLSGYLFINGFWLKNDADYTISLTSEGKYAVLAQLDLPNRLITLTSESYVEGSSFSNALVLALITIDANSDVTVEDTRSNDSLCGVIDSVGNLKPTIDYLIDYIENHIETLLNQEEERINGKIGDLNNAIQDAEDELAIMQGDPIGTIKYSATQISDPSWLLCDGEFISSSDYPDLVTALGAHH